MSTRSVIARPAGDGFAGRYHHFDGYPTGLGKTLWDLYRDRYAEDLEAMTAELIDAHPAGWSSINGADWSLEPGFVNRSEYSCAACGVSSSAHYRQSLPDDHPLRHPAPGTGQSYLLADHAPEEPVRPTPPMCYCHGDRSESEHLITSWGDDGGTEWAYVLSPGGLVVCERRWNDDGSHMVGMFGYGAAEGKASWLVLGIYPWHGPEPDWNALERAEATS